jgi:hypothetical protein
MDSPEKWTFFKVKGWKEVKVLAIPFTWTIQ